MCALLLLATPALAGETNEVWPELGFYVSLTPRTRLFFDAPFAKGMETADRTLEVTATNALGFFLKWYF